MGNVPPSAYCNVTEPFASLPICCAGGKGTVLGGSRPFPGIDEFSRGGLAILYLVFLLWTFVGVALAADVFMSAIEEITSQESTVTTQSKDGKIRRFRARVWNPTVANLTLMALGSSAAVATRSTPRQHRTSLSGRDQAGRAAHERVALVDHLALAAWLPPPPAGSRHHPILSRHPLHATATIRPRSVAQPWASR